MRCVALANPENRRTTYFREALQRHLGAPLEVVSWENFLRGQILPQEIDLFRIESPGENHTVERLLIALGAEYRGITCPDIDPTHGRIQHMGLWFEGFRCALEKNIPNFPPHTFMNGPEGILAMMDKAEASTRLLAGNIPLPPHHGIIRSYDEFQNLVEQGHTRLFLKPRYGSSASGVMAWRRSLSHQEVMTSVELDDSRLFNSLKVRRYTSETQIAQLVDTLGEDGLVCETWVPKATIHGKAFDLRVMAVQNHPPQHIVVRLSNSPMTNLHLGNQRGDVSQIMEHVGLPLWNEMLQSTESALTCFPDALYSGFDVLFDVTRKHFFVIEANSFGDLLPNVFYDFLDTYDLEVMSWLSNHPSNSKTLFKAST